MFFFAVGVLDINIALRSNFATTILLLFRYQRNG